MKFKIIWNDRSFGTGEIEAKDEMEACYKLQRKYGDIRGFYELKEVTDKTSKENLK